MDNSKTKRVDLRKPTLEIVPEAHLWNKSHWSGKTMWEVVRVNLLIINNDVEATKDMFIERLQSVAAQYFGNAELNDNCPNPEEFTIESERHGKTSYDTMWVEVLCKVPARERVENRSMLHEELYIVELGCVHHFLFNEHFGESAYDKQTYNNWYVVNEEAYEFYKNSKPHDRCNIWTQLYHYYYDNARPAA